MAQPLRVRTSVLTHRHRIRISKASCDLSPKAGRHRRNTGAPWLLAYLRK